MKTTFKKITAISLAAFTVACASCFTSFAAENKYEAESEKNNGYYYGDITPDYENGAWNYDDNGYTVYDIDIEYKDDYYTAENNLACE